MLNDTVQKNGNRNTIVTTNARSVRIEARMPASSLRIGHDRSFLARIASVPGLDDAPGRGRPSTAHDWYWAPGPGSWPSSRGCEGQQEGHACHRHPPPCRDGW